MKSLKLLINSLSFYSIYSQPVELPDDLPYPVVWKEIEVTNLKYSSSGQRKTKIKQFTFNKNNDPINKIDRFAGIVVWDVGTLEKNKEMGDFSRYYLGDNSTGPQEEAEITPGHIFIKQSSIDCSFFDQTCARGRGMVHGAMVQFLFKASRHNRYHWQDMYGSENVLLGGFSITGGKLKTSSIWLNGDKNRKFSVTSSACENGGGKPDGPRYMSNCENYMLYRAIERFLEDGQTRHEYDADEIAFEHGTSAYDAGHFHSESIELPHLENRQKNEINQSTQDVVRAFPSIWYPAERPTTCDSNGRLRSEFSCRS